MNENKILIDASNLKSFGGIKYLYNLIKFNEFFNSKNIFIACNEKTFLELPENKFVKIKSSLLNKNILYRTIWKLFFLKKILIKNKIDCLVAIDSFNLIKFKNKISFSLNLLPFDNNEIKRFGLNPLFFKFHLLRLIQKITFDSSDGVIFSSNISLKKISFYLKNKKVKKTIIPIGINNLDICKPAKQKNISKYNKSNPYKIIYVSNFLPYKNHLSLIEAFDLLSKKYPIKLILVNSKFSFNLKSLTKKIKNKILSNDNIQIIDNLHTSKEVSTFLKDMDLFFFNSSCENFPNILIEGMASGLPIVTTNIEPMNEIVNEKSAILVDPFDTKDIIKKLETIINDENKRAQICNSSVVINKKYLWNKVVKDSFEFIISNIKP